MVCSSLKIERTRNMELVKQLWGDPRIYSQMCDDGCPENSIDWQPADSDRRYFLVPSLEQAQNKILLGIVAYYAISFVMYEIHIGILPEFQHQITPEIVFFANDWLFKHTECQKIIGYIPVIKQNVRKLALKCGFKDEGYIQNSFLFKGTLIDQYVMTIGRN